MSSDANTPRKPPAKSEIKPFLYVKAEKTKVKKEPDVKKDPDVKREPGVKREPDVKRELEIKKEPDEQQEAMGQDEAEVLREVSSLEKKNASLVADIELWKAKERALQARITSYAELNKLIRRGARASNAFTAATIYLKRMVKALTDAEKQVITEETATQPKKG